MKKAFAYPVVMCVLVLLTVFSITMIRRYTQTQFQQVQWSMLEQSQLNLHNALNLFLRQNATYSIGGHGSFEFEPQNGCSWNFLPIGLYFLVDVDGYCGPHKLEKTWIVGARGLDDPVLALDEEVDEIALKNDAEIEGVIEFNDATQTLWNPSPAVEPLAERVQLPEYSYDGLAQQLRFQWTEDWEKQITTLLPDLRVIKGASTLDLEKISGKKPILIKAGNLTLRGQLKGPGIRIFLVNSLQTEDAELETAWIMSKHEVVFRENTVADQIHIIAPQISLQDQFDFQRSSLTAIAWAEDRSTTATISLRGEGFFHGSMVALPMEKGIQSDFEFEHEGQAKISKQATVRSAGLIFCCNIVSIRGSHTGSVRAGIWEFVDHHRRFVGRIEDVSLQKGMAGYTIWGLGSKSGEPVYELPIKTQ